MLKRIITMALSLTLMIVMGVTSFASDTPTANSFTFVADEESLDLNARYPGYAGLSYVSAKPVLLSTNTASTTSTRVSSTTGRDQNLNVTLDSTTRTQYNKISANAYELTIGLNLTGVTRFEVYLNGQYVGSQNCYSSAGVITAVLEDKKPAQYKIVLYDNVTPTQGKILWGNINYN